MLAPGVQQCSSQPSQEVEMPEVVFLDPPQGISGLNEASFRQHQ